MSGNVRPRIISAPDFEVKIVGGKRMVIWRPEINENAGMLQKSRSLSSIDHFLNNNGVMSRPLQLPPIHGQSELTFSSNPEHDINLWRELHLILRNFEEKQLVELLEDLKRRDLQEKGLTTPKTLAAIAAQYQLPVPPYLLQTLCERFATNFIPISVQFEKLVSYLINCKSDPPPVEPLVNSRASTTSSAQMSTIQLEPIQREKIEQSKASTSFTPNNQLKGLDEARVVHELEKELKDDDMRYDLFRRHAYELDSGRRGVLSKQQIESLLNATNITISEQVLTKILRFCDKQGYGLYNLTDFLGFFERAKVQSQELFQPSQRKIIRPRTPTIHVGPLPKVAPIIPTNPVQSLQRPISLPTLIPLTQEEWLSRFDRMTSALKSSCQDQRGHLATSELLQMVDNYNIVYNLQLDATNIQKGVDYAGRNFPGFVAVEPFTSHLRELHLKENYWNSF